MIPTIKEHLSRLWKNHPRLSLLLAALPLPASSL